MARGIQSCGPLIYYCTLCEEKQEVWLLVHVLSYVLEHGTEVRAPQTLDLPFLIGRRNSSICVVLHFLDFGVALDDVKLEFPE